MVARSDKDVEAVLLNTKILRRRPGDVPYPVERCNGMSNFDIWDNMFIHTTCRSLTMHQFNNPPAVILDLGCGSGYWAIQAAKHWKNSMVVGYDLYDIQPKLLTFEQHEDIAHRIEWVHGNLLDGLPFPACHFDFVRIVNIGLGIPEDEWQFVFEEAARVMKPGAAIEVIEEDPIFPCAQPSQSRPQLPSITVDLPIVSESTSESTPSSAYSSQSSTTLASESWTTALDDRSDFTSTSHSSKLVASSSLSLEYPYNTPPLLRYIPRAPSVSEPDGTPDLRDHSKLKAAWEAMLSSRFLATNLLAVLPFYFSSSFVDVQTRPPFKVLLPPNSHGDRTPLFHRSEDSFFTESVYTTSSSTHSCSSTKRTECLNLPQEAPCNNTMWRNLHLARTVNTVTGCKEAIWQEYKRLYATELMPLLARTTRPEGIRAQHEYFAREAFDAQWSSWQNDMADRIGMRTSAMLQFGWTEPAGPSPDWRVWRSTVAKNQLREERYLSKPLTCSRPKKDLDICRSMRGFVGWKP